MAVFAVAIDLTSRTVGQERRNIGIRGFVQANRISCRSARSGKDLDSCCASGSAASTSSRSTFTALARRYCHIRTAIGVPLKAGAGGRVAGGTARTGRAAVALDLRDIEGPKASRGIQTKSDDHPEADVATKHLRDKRPFHQNPPANTAPAWPGPNAGKIATLVDELAPALSPKPYRIAPVTMQAAPTPYPTQAMVL
jgi:hypothetical protein